jgi:hypothetical protein
VFLKLTSQNFPLKIGGYIFKLTEAAAMSVLALVSNWNNKLEPSCGISNKLLS